MWPTGWVRLVFLAVVSAMVRVSRCSTLFLSISSEERKSGRDGSKLSRWDSRLTRPRAALAAPGRREPGSPGLPARMLREHRTHVRREAVLRDR